MVIEVVGQPPQSFINPYNKIMEIVVASRVVCGHFLKHFIPKEITLHEQIVQRKENLIDVKEDVGLEVNVSDWMRNYVVYRLFFHQNRY